MPSSSKAQQRFFGVVKAMQKGDLPKTGKAGKIAKTMDKDDVDDFASTKHKGKPEKVKREMKVRNLIKKMVREELAKMNEGTCGYGENGQIGEEPAGPHLIKKKLKEKQSAAVQRMAKKGMWVVYDTPGEQTIKVVKNERAAKMLVKKLKKSGKYNRPEAKAIKLEGKLTEAKETIFDVAARVMKDKQHQNYKSKKGMVKLDMQTANLLTQVFKKINPKMKKILSDLGEKNPAQLVQTLQAVIK